MGLLDFATDPQSSMLTNMGLGLLSAGGPSSRPVSLGQAIGSAGQMGMEGFQQAQQNQMRQMQLGDAQRKQLALKQFREQLPPEMRSMFDVAPEAVLSQMFKEDTPIALGEGGQLVKKDGTVIAANPKKELKDGYIIPDGQGGWKIDQTLYQAALGQNRARANSTNVFNNTKDNFKNERDLRNDFSGLPTTKAFNEVRSAYDQIKTSIKQQSPAGDLAAATKIMKILDPGSVVRESELGMAISASGLLDRISNYANMTLSGQKLTPAQRKDFGDLAEKLYSVSADRYNQSVGEYQNVAKDYGLNAGRVAKPADNAGGFDIVEAAKAELAKRGKK